VLQFVCDVVKDTGKEEYLRPFVRIGLDRIGIPHDFPCTAVEFRGIVVLN